MIEGPKRYFRINSHPALFSPLLKFLVVLLLVLPQLALAQSRPVAAPRQQSAGKAKKAPLKPSASPIKSKKKPPAAVRPVPVTTAKVPAFTRYLHSPWVDSLMHALTPDQRAAQLFMVAAYSNRKRIDEDSISALIQQYGIGGLIFFQGGPARQARLLNRYQSQSRVPLLVALDGEWGVGMRLDSVVKFPYQMSLGGETDTALLYDMGREVARQFKRLGMHVNFAPVVDVNNNAANP
ncbi:MAG: serine hydrolase, partial [Hymenobacter sp.]|nr:serine hydrolase [Hymenobacter sp.]